MIPFHLEIRGLRDADFDMRDRRRAPAGAGALVAAATVGGIDSATFTNGPQGTRPGGDPPDLKGWGELPVRQSFDGPNAANEAAAHLVAFAAFLTGNPLERVEIEGIDVTLTQSVQPAHGHPGGGPCRAHRGAAGRPGAAEPDFKSYQGETFRRTGGGGGAGGPAGGPPVDAGGRRRERRRRPPDPRAGRSR